VDACYSKNVSRWREGDSIKISSITLPKYTGETGSTAESQFKLANELRRKITKGGDFSTVARNYSQDSHAENGGAWEWMSKGQMKASMAEVAFTLKQGQVSNVLDEEGFYIILVCDAIKYGKSKPLTEVRDEVERMVKSEKSKSILDKWMEDLRRRAVIKKFGW
jgi:peptidyl-prolyl cis-trans isomerase SurA